MARPLKSILKSLSDSNYLIANSVRNKNKTVTYEASLLKNGLKIQEHLLKQWCTTSVSWATHRGDIVHHNQNVRNKMEDENDLGFLQNDEFKKLYQYITRQDLVSSSNSIVKRTISKNAFNDIINKDLFCCSNANTLLVSEFFVSSESGLSRFYNLQRERKIWWMRFSANASRYCVEPFDVCLKEPYQNEVTRNIKSIKIKANFPFGSVNIETITIVPLFELDFLNSSSPGDLLNISLIRSVIKLELTTCALILDASDCCTRNCNRLMLNSKLAPYQISLSSSYRGNKMIEDLLLHLKHVISRSGLRLYDKSISVNNQTELEKKFMDFDNLGIPYTLIVDDESIKSGLLKLRSRDTTLFETIHISDVTDYLLQIYKQ